MAMMAVRKILHLEFPWYAEALACVTRNAIGDLDHAFKYFLLHVKKIGKAVDYASQIDPSKSQYLNKPINTSPLFQLILKTMSQV